MRKKGKAELKVKGSKGRRVKVEKKGKKERPT